MGRKMATNRIKRIGSRRKDIGGEKLRLQRGKAEQTQEAISRNIGAGISTAPHILVSPNDLCHITLSFSHTLYAIVNCHMYIIHYICRVLSKKIIDTYVVGSVDILLAYSVNWYNLVSNYKSEIRLYFF